MTYMYEERTSPSISRKVENEQTTESEVKVERLSAEIETRFDELKTGRPKRIIQKFKLTND